MKHLPLPSRSALLSLTSVSEDLYQRALSADEYSSVESFIEDLLFGDEELVYGFADLQILSFRTQLTIPEIRSYLDAYGLTLAKRVVPNEVRGFSANGNNRWASSPSHGGSGTEQIQGFAGNPG